MVVGFHAAELQHFMNVGGSWPNYVLSSGVDIFFIISGFLMVYVSRNVVGATEFFYNRLLRVAPLYWLLTLVLGIAILAQPRLSEKPVDEWMLVKSMLFIPTDLGPSTLQTTIVSVGWTLVYEMYFYTLFALALALRLPVRVLIAALIMATCAHPFVGNFYLRIYTSPMLLEFAIGMALGCAPKMITWLQLKARAPMLLAIGVLALIAGGMLAGPQMVYRPLLIGVPAALIVAAAIAMPVHSVFALELLGNASYSIYLFHMYFIKYVGAKLLPSSWIALVVVGVLGGIGLYYLIERPLMRLVMRFKNIRSGLTPSASASKGS